MRFFRPIFMALLVAGLAGYAMDCLAMSTPDEAMQCCDSMPCPSPGHNGSEDCCNTMSALHAPFLQAHAAHDFSPAPGFFAMLPGVHATQDIRPSAHVVVVAHGHAPPIPQPSLSPLRI
jgi:hypothetical protein